MRNSQDVINVNSILLKYFFFFIFLGEFNASAWSKITTLLDFVFLLLLIFQFGVSSNIFVCLYNISFCFTCCWTLLKGYTAFWGLFFIQYRKRQTMSLCVSFIVTAAWGPSAGEFHSAFISPLSMVISVVSNHFLLFWTKLIGTFLYMFSGHICSRVLGCSYLTGELLNCKMCKYSTLWNKVKLCFKVVAPI